MRPATASAIVASARIGGTAESRLRVILYDNPFRSHIVIAPETIARMEEERLVVGMKASEQFPEGLRLACFALPGFTLGSRIKAISCTGLELI
ncbi:MAG: hypothetical protein K0R27_4640 [Xanthobacteraceae bacterium]|nr:hypothetical protein [Xanthobacteraceae bacterium]